MGNTVHPDYIWSSQLSCAQVVQLELVGLSGFAMFAGCTGSMKQCIVNLHFLVWFVHAVSRSLLAPCAAGVNAHHNDRVEHRMQQLSGVLLNTQL